MYLTFTFPTELINVNKISLIFVQLKYFSLKDELMQGGKCRDLNISSSLDQTLLLLSFKFDRIELQISKLSMVNGTWLSSMTCRFCRATITLVANGQRLSQSSNPCSVQWVFAWAEHHYRTALGLPVESLGVLHR